MSNPFPLDTVLILSHLVLWPNLLFVHRDSRQRRRGDPRLKSNEFMASTMSSIYEQESPSWDLAVTKYDPRNDPRRMAQSPSFDRETSLGPAQQQRLVYPLQVNACRSRFHGSQLDVFSSGHRSNADSSVFSNNRPALAFNYPQASSPLVHQYDHQPNSSTSSRPSALSRMTGSVDGRAEDVQYGQLDQGMAGQLGTILQYLPPGPQKRSTTEIRAFSRLSREEQRAANQARLVKCGWTDDCGLQTCAAVMSAKDMRKHMQNYHNVPRRETKQTSSQFSKCGAMMVSTRIYIVSFIASA
ncbi:hypothetical protein C8J56DRAFT_1048499 [Mycena floridula]|nr:hypothetical protein C8J56DRAFT_1048499 [Mycena floridula]